MGIDNSWIPPFLTPFPYSERLHASHAELLLFSFYNCNPSWGKRANRISFHSKEHRKYFTVDRLWNIQTLEQYTRCNKHTNRKNVLYESQQQQTATNKQWISTILKKTTTMRAKSAWKVVQESQSSPLECDFFSLSCFSHDHNFCSLHNHHHTHTEHARRYFRAGDESNSITWLGGRHFQHVKHLRLSCRR